MVSPLGDSYRWQPSVRLHTVYMALADNQAVEQEEGEPITKGHYCAAAPPLKQS